MVKCREYWKVGLPNGISLTDGGWQDGVDVFTVGSAYLSPAYVLFTMPGAPPEFKVTNIALDNSLYDQFNKRLTLRGQFDRLRRGIDKAGRIAAIDGFISQATGIRTSDRTRKAFDLSQEPGHIMTRYGKHASRNAADAVIATRRGRVQLSLVAVENPRQPGTAWRTARTYKWESHLVYCHISNVAQSRLPLYEQPMKAPMEDLHTRWTSRKTQLLVTGDFCRMPCVKYRTGSQAGMLQPGRDRFPSTISLFVSRGGAQMTCSRNAKGDKPKGRPLVPGNLWTTVFRHLEIDPNRSFPNYSGRQMKILPEGSTITEKQRQFPNLDLRIVDTLT